MAKAQNVEVSLDRQSRDSIRSLVAAVDGLAKAINDGKKVDTDWVANPGDVAILQRLVEDVTRRETSDGQSLPNDESYYRDADGRLQRDRRDRPNVDQVFTERTAG
jgi:hypothetical protein